MLYNDIIKADKNTVWAVLDRHSHASVEARKSLNVHRSVTSMATIVDFTNRVPNTRMVDLNDAQAFFSVAPSNARTKFFLVTDGNYAWLARPQDILAPYPVYDAHISVMEAEQKVKEEAQARQYAIREDALRSVNDRIGDIEESIKSSVKKYLGISGSMGTTTNIRPEGSWNDDSTVYNADVSGYVSIEYAQFQRLMEILGDAIEANE